MCFFFLFFVWGKKNRIFGGRSQKTARNRWCIAVVVVVVVVVVVDDDDDDDDDDVGGGGGGFEVII